MLTALIDFIFPRHCRVCGKRLTPTEKSICGGCLVDLILSEFAEGETGNRLERTMWKRLPIERAAAFMIYDHEDSYRNLVLDLKYHNQPAIGYHIGRIMSRQLADNHFFDGIDLIVPVPIPRDKLRKRGYNQSDQIAYGVSQITGIPVNSGIIKRKKYKTSQTQLTPNQRQENVKGSFELKAKYVKPKNPSCDLSGKHILIVDDVITTTATVQECGKTLSQIPGIKLSVLSLAVSKNYITNVRKANPSEE
ncbi:MAG: ComF family protein [Bacteroidaceae bacterium]|nr:ComF family protein [Bacteroidaceae bacterium]